MAAQPPVHPPVHQSASGSYIAQAAGGSTATVNVLHWPGPQPVDEEVLAEARKRLAALPRDTIPPLADALPPGSRVELRPNPLFVGRQLDLQRLAPLLGPSASVAGRPAGRPLVAVTGLGGLGKSQLAVEFVHRYGLYFAGGVFWLSFASTADVPGQVAACASESLGLRPDFRALGFEAQVQLVKAAWQSPLPRLLVFDNCQDPTLLAPWVPPSGGCRVLVTSRRAAWDAALGVELLPLGLLTTDESVALLRAHRPDLSATDPDLGAIAVELGHLPLALHLAGHHLRRYQHAVTPRDYLEQLQRPGLLDHLSLQAGGLSPTGHEQHVAKTFKLSTDALNPADGRDSLARHLLARAAYLAPGIPIPRQLLTGALEQPPAPPLPRPWWRRWWRRWFGGGDKPAPISEPPGRIAIEDALARLTELGLLEADMVGALRLHILVARFVGAEIADAAAQPAVERAVLEAVRSLYAGADPRPLLSLQPRLRAVTDAARERFDTVAAPLCGWLGILFKAQGDLAGARPYYGRALAIAERVLGPDHPTAQVVRQILTALKIGEAWP